MSVCNNNAAYAALIGYMDNLTAIVDGGRHK